MIQLITVRKKILKKGKGKEKKIDDRSMVGQWY